MNLADALTASRLVLAPFFFLIYMYGQSIGITGSAMALILWILLILMELSDLLDGMVARAMKSVSAFGKLFDPFSDVLARITYFVCFAWTGIMPLWILLIILYREFSILFLRMLLAERGIAMGARPGGKTKAVTYMVAGVLSLVRWSFASLAWQEPSYLPGLVYGFYVLAAVLSVASFVDYLFQYRKLISAR
jgi:CDP-diacylglycerol---glycerol-3-phosphate 3-phosphatidyltransferase